MYARLMKWNDRLDQQMRALGWNKAELARRADVPYDSVNKYLRGEIEQPRGDTLKKLADAIGVSEIWLRDGIDSASAMPAFNLKHIPDLAIHAGLGNGGLLDVSVDESGSPTDPDQVRGYWSFPDYVLAGIQNLRRCYAFAVTGDSMYPTLPGGSVVFVDTSQHLVPPEDIYAIDYGDGLMVKRLKLVPRSESMSIISDNERYGSDELRREDVRIYGRVIGWFQWRG